MKKQTSLEFTTVTALILAAVAYRVGTGILGGTAGWLSNFSPMAAIVLCGAIYLPVRAGLLLPAAILLLSDLILNLHFGSPLFDGSMLARYAAFAALAGCGLLFRNNPNPARILAGSLAGSIGFYLVTNTANWLTMGGYAKSFAGWAQALTTGLPGYPPTWMFFCNSVASDLLFTALILVCVSAARERETHPRAVAIG